MQLELRRRLLDESSMRPVIAAAVTLTAVAAFASREEQIVSLVFLAPTIVVFWAWAVGRRRRSGVAHAFGLVVPIILNIIESDDEIAMFISMFTIIAFAAWIRSRSYVRTVIGVFMFLVALFGVVEAISDFAWWNWLCGALLAWGAGEVIWRYSDTVEELRQTRSLVSDQAALEERRRIAHDVHDLVGHSLSVVMMHVAGARLLVRKDPDEAERALEQAEDAARRSLADIRRTVGMLRDETDGGAPALPSAELADIPELVDELVAAGQLVDLTMTGRVADVDPAVSLAGYRITQEALTNASRHTVGASIAVHVSVDDETCHIVVANEGGQVIDLAQGSGFGLVSMRERAKSVGGSLLAGPTRDGWTVEATLPISTGRRAPIAGLLR